MDYSFELFFKEGSLRYRQRREGIPGSDLESSRQAGGRQAVSAALLCHPGILSREGYREHLLV